MRVFLTCEASKVHESLQGENNFRLNETIRT